MNRFLLTGLCAALACGAALADVPTAAQWAGWNAKALNDFNDAAKAEIIRKGPEGFRALAAKIKTGGASDALAATKIAALTQYVMAMRGPDARAAHAALLLQAAQEAKDADVVCFYLDQLRWCGLPAQAAAIRAFESSKLPGVADLAKMTAQSVTREIVRRGPPEKLTAAAALARRLDAMPAAAAQAELVRLVNAPGTERGVLRIALERGAAGDASTTPLWVEAFKNQTDPVRKTMLAELLGGRKDPAAAAALAAALESEDKNLAETAAGALFRSNLPALAAALPGWLKRAAPAGYQTLRDLLLRCPPDEIAGTLVKAYPAASETGKRAALDFFKERKTAAAVPHGLSAIASENADLAVAGYRFLRETAGPAQAGELTARALATSGRVTPEAQNALAAAGRRDASGAYRAALLAAIEDPGAPDGRKAVALETAARLGGADLLKAVRRRVDSDKAELSNAAVRSLAAWEGNESIPALMSLAIAGKTARIQTLAVRGAEKKLAAAGAETAAFLPAWRAARALPGNEGNKKTLSAFFGKTINVARGGKVTANVPSEGANVPQNLIDGTLEKAWYAARTPAAAEIDLGREIPVSAARVVFFHQDTRTYTFKLELSADGKKWKKAGGNEAAPKPASAEGVRMEFPETPARYARLTVLKNSANPAAHVLELELFATPK